MLLGRGRFVGDLTRAGMLHAAFARSPFPAAEVTGIDTSAALALPGVGAAFTAADLGHPYLMAILERDEFTPTRMPVLAGDQVRFAGEPVAMVLADDPYAAQDGAELVDVDWRPLPAISGIDTARAAAARQVHDGLSGNCLVDLTMFDDPKLPGILAAAPVVIDAVFRSARVAALPLEGRACLAEWDDRDRQLVLHVSTQVPHQVRTARRAGPGHAGARRAGDRPGRRRRVRAQVRGRQGRDRGGRRGAAAAPPGVLDRGPAGEPHRVVPRARAAVPGSGGVRPATAAILGLGAEIDCDIGAYSAFPFSCRRWSR